MFKFFLAIAITIFTTTFAQASDEHIFKFDDVNWQPAGLEGAEMAALWGSEEEGTAIWAFRLQPGVAIPVHTHSNSYWGIGIQGKWVHIDSKGNEVITEQDAYTLIRSGESHADRCAGPDVCINILDFQGKRDIIFPK